jgi:hypothetical protein
VLPPGDHTIQIEATDDRGQRVRSNAQTVRVVVPPPIGGSTRVQLDGPRGVVSGMTAGGGWAFRCGGSIASYRLLVNGAPWAEPFATGGSRPDVANFFRGECPAISDGTGFGFTLDTTMLQPGLNVLQVEATDDRGQVVRSNTVQVAVSAHPPTTLSPLACSAEPNLRSVEGLTHAPIEFVNLSGQARRLYWLDYGGARVFYNALEPGRNVVENTYLTHPWVVADAADACLGIYVPVPGSSRAELR